MNNFKSILILALVFLMVSSCYKDRHTEGYDFIPDMVYSKAYDSYSINRVFKDSMSQRLPVKFTKPKNHSTFRFSVLPENRLLARYRLKNLIKVNKEYLEEGKELYKNYCYQCHGLKGRGNGFLATSGKLPVKPQDLQIERLKLAAKGEIFHVITNGMGLMGAHGAQLSEEDRWKIVEHVKVFIQGITEDRSLLGEESSMETLEQFEKRVKKYFSSIGIGPAKPVKLGSLNKSWVKEGEKIFKLKCSSCHKPTKKFIGPAPRGILKRRNPQWVMNMILDPELMVSKDPLAKELLKYYLSPMANQNLTEEQARKVLEYFRTIK